MACDLGCKYQIFHLRMCCETHFLCPHSMNYARLQAINEFSTYPYAVVVILKSFQLSMILSNSENDTFLYSIFPVVLQDLENTYLPRSCCLFPSITKHAQQTLHQALGLH